MATITNPSDPRNYQVEEMYPFDGQQASVSAATIAGFIAQRAYVLRGLRGRLAVCGTVQDSIVQVHKNGTLITGASVTIAHAGSDPTVFSIALNEPIAPGDAITMVVTQAATGATGLVCSGYVVRDM